MNIRSFCILEREQCAHTVFRFWLNVVVNHETYLTSTQIYIQQTQSNTRSSVYRSLSGISWISLHFTVHVYPQRVCCANVDDRHAAQRLNTSSVNERTTDKSVDRYYLHLTKTFLLDIMRQKKMLGRIRIIKFPVKSIVLLFLVSTYFHHVLVTRWKARTS